MSLINTTPFFKEASPPPIPLLKDVKASNGGLTVSNNPKLPAGTLAMISVSYFGGNLLGVYNNTGWTTVANVKSTTPANHSLALYAKALTGSEPTSFAIDYSGVYFSFVARLFYWLPGDHGVVNLVTDITKQQSFGYNNAYIPVSVPAINLLPGYRLMYFFGYGNFGNTFTPFPPTGHAQLFSPWGYSDAHDLSFYPTNQTPRNVSSFNVIWNVPVYWIVIPFTVKG